MASVPCEGAMYGKEKAENGCGFVRTEATAKEEEKAIYNCGTFSADTMYCHHLNSEGKHLVLNGLPSSDARHCCGVIYFSVGCLPRSLFTYSIQTAFTDGVGVRQTTTDHSQKRVTHSSAPDLADSPASPSPAEPSAALPKVKLTQVTIHALQRSAPFSRRARSALTPLLVPPKGCLLDLGNLADANSSTWSLYDKTVHLGHIQCTTEALARAGRAGAEHPKAELPGRRCPDWVGRFESPECITALFTKQYQSSTHVITKSGTLTKVRSSPFPKRIHSLANMRQMTLFMSTGPRRRVPPFLSL